MAKKKVKKSKPKPKPAPKTVKEKSLDSINSEVIAAALSSINQPVLLKVCRLCESKDGPFLNIFDADKVTAKKIEELMPFGIAENDDLPHKICFRCSAKVEELYEFIQKCIKTQESLHSAVGKREPIISKNKTRTLWEQKLNKSNISNDDICDALIKKAMESIKNIPVNPKLLEDDSDDDKPIISKEKSDVLKKQVKQNSSEIDIDTNVHTDKNDQRVPLTRSKRQNPDTIVDLVENNKADNKKTLGNKKTPQEIEDNKKEDSENKNKNTFKSINDFSMEIDDSDDDVAISDISTKNKVGNDPSKSTFDIMDHVSKIKVNGVGVLFQCKLCNRNFLKKEVVISHGCSKSIIPKIDITTPLPQPEPPKTSTIKYIKLDNNTKTTNHTKPDNVKTVPEEQSSSYLIGLEVKPKPKIGPASKVRKESNNSQANTTTNETLSGSSKNELPLPMVTTTMPLPAMPNLSSRYKLIPGPNNSFTLVEDAKSNENEITPKENILPPKQTQKKRKADETAKQPPYTQKSSEVKPKDRRLHVPSPDVIELDENSQSHSDNQPYPVGLFQTAHHSSIYVPPVASPPAFSTSASKKQSYTVVQTGNPSKLLISTKPQPPVEELPKKRLKRNKTDPKDDDKEPFNVTLEDVSHQKDPGFFTFINVDPLLQPSYVLPIDNIIQESQISTSTAAVAKSSDVRDKEKYSCNMCGEKFSREKKLLAHVQSHYAKMDEEDELRENTVNKRKGRRT